MMIRNPFIKLFPLILISIMILFTVGVQAATDTFERADGALGSSWQASPELVVQSGNFHNSGPDNSWKYTAVYNQESDPNRVEMQLAGSTDGCDTNGAGLVGIAYLNALSATADGYFIHYRVVANEYRLYVRKDQALALVNTLASGGTALTPGSTLRVDFNDINYTFDVYVDGTSVGTLQDAAHSGRGITWSTHYAGIISFGNGQLNDVESFSASYVIPSTDVTPPATISDLSATATSSSIVRLAWTATGDDGTGGTASAYDIRYSTSTITSSNFNAATKVPTPPTPTTPRTSGLDEAINVSGLAASTLYYFAIKARDEDNNWSNISNVPSATTAEGTTPTGSYKSITDDFERTDLGPDWNATASVIIQDGTLYHGATSGWSNFSVYVTKNNPTAVAYRYASDLVGDQATITAGHAVLLDNTDPSLMNGYLVLKRNDNVTLYAINNGTVGAKLSEVAGALEDPVNGDEVKTEITVDEATNDQTFNFYINDVFDAQIVLSAASYNPGTTWYSGIVQHGAYDNRIEDFTFFYEGSGGPESISAYSGGDQSGPIQQQLPNPVVVQVLDAAGEPYEGALLDFQITQGSARLDDLEDFAFDGYIWREAESGNILHAAAKVQEDENASNGEYIYLDYIAGTREKRMFEIPFYIPENLNYNIYMRYKTNDKDNFYAGIDNGDSTLVTLTNKNNVWTWQKVLNKTLTKGLHTFNYILWEPYISIDKILIVDNTKTVSLGSSQGGSGPDFPNVTDADGFASTHVTFGTDADTNVVINVSGTKSDGSDLEGSPAVFTLDPTAGNAYSMGEAYTTSASPGADLELFVTIKDSYGNLKDGVTTNWSITQGNGGLSAPQTVSDENGQAKVVLTLSRTQSTPYIVRASVSGLVGSPVDITVNPSEPAKYIQRISPVTEQQGTARSTLDSLVIVRVLKEDKVTPFESFPIDFSIIRGTGKLWENTIADSSETKTISTDADGYAEVHWLLGGLGKNEVQAFGQSLTGTPEGTTNPIVFSAEASEGVPSILTIVSGDNQTDGYVGLPVDPFVVKLTDDNGFTIPSYPIRFDVIDGVGGYLGHADSTSRTIYTNSLGQASVTLTLGCELNEVHRVRATALETGITPVTFSATPTGVAASNIEYVSGNNVNGAYQEATVTNPLEQPFVVRVFNAVCNQPVAGQSVKFTVAQGNGNFNNQNSVSVVSDADGLASATLTLGTQAGDSVYVVNVTSNLVNTPTQQLAGSPVVFKATGIAKTPVSMSKDATTDQQVAVVGQALPNAVRVKVADEHGNGIQNHPVTFTVTGNGGALVDNMGSDQIKEVLTGSDGYASIVWQMPEKPGFVQLTAAGKKADNTALTNSPLTFTAFADTGAANIMEKAIPGDPELVGVAGKALSQKVRVKISDKFGNAVKHGYPVTFTVMDGGGRVNSATQVTVQTADSGYASVTWVMGTASGYENNVLKANASVTNNPELEFKATVVADIAAIMSPQPISDEFVKAGNLLSDPVSVKITDQYGNGIDEFPVLFQVVDVNGNMGYLEVLGQTSYTDSTDENGIAQVNWGMGPNVGLNINKLRVVAQRNGIDLENSPYEGYLVSTSVGDPDSLIKITDEPLESVVGNTVTLSVKVTDAFGNPRAAQPVEFKVLSATTAGGGYFDGDEEKIEITKNSDSNGHVTVQFTLGNLAGVNINKVQISSAYNGEPLNGSPALYEISAKSTNATRIAIEDGDDQNGTVGKFVDEMLKVVAYDRDGNRVTQPQPIRFQIVDGETKGGALGYGTAIDTTINTDASGVAEIAWRLGPKVGAYEVNASSKSGSTDLDGSPLTFSANAAADITDADTSKVDVFPPVQVVSNGGNKITIVARLKDKFGNPIKDRAVVFSAINANGVTITQPIQATDINGEASGQVYSTTVGIKQILCRDINSQVQLSDTARVTFTAAAAARIDEHEDSGDGGTGNIGTVLGDSLRVMVTDEFGNPIDNHNVTFSVTAGNGQVLENQPVSTDSTGMAFVRYRLGQETGTNTIEATAIGIAGQKVRFNLTAEENSPAQIKMVSGNKSSAKAGEQLPEPFVVRVVDAYNKPVWNVEVLWKGVLNPGSIVSENPITTDEYGKASANVLVSSTVGENIYSAEIPSSPSISAQTFYATTTANKATGIEYGTDSELEGVVNQSLTQALVINTVDEHGNRVPSVNVTFTVMEGETVDGVGYLQNGAKVMSIASNTNGQALAYYTLGKKAGINRVRASSSGLEPTYREFVITGVADVADSMFVYSGNNQKMEKGKELLEPIVVRVVDQWGNPASNGRVSFAAIQGGGTIIADNPVSSNNQGLAKARWILGPTANVANIAVVISNNNLKFAGDRLEFLATAESNQYPEFQMLERYEVYENELLQFFVLATDGDGDFVNYNKANMPADTSAKFLYDTINEKYKFQWKPGYDLVQRPETEKTYYPVFYAEDTKGGRDIDTVKVVVKNKNRMPVINSYVPIDNYYKFNLEDGVIEFSVSATDPDNDALYYTWRVGDVVKGNSQSFTLNPNDLYPNLNNISVSVEVSDGENSTTFNWTLSSVQLTSFTADVTPYQGVILEWETTSEHNNAGFNVLRGMKEEGTYAKINKDLLDPEVDGKYEYIDNDIEGGYHYYYKIEDVSLSGIRTQHGPVTAEAPLPKDFNLSQNYPNPFNPTTTVRYELPKTAQVRLDIYNTMGQLVKTLINRQVKAGYHTVMWNGKDENQMTVSSGIYYYRIKAGNFSRIHKMVFLK